MLFIAVYALLDWASYLHALHGLNITPWNPALALGLTCSLRFGRRAALPWFIALLADEYVIRGLPSPLFSTLVQSLVLVIGYGKIADILRHFVYRNGGLSSQRNFFSWLAIVVFGTFLTSSLYLLILFVSGMIPVDEWRVSVLRFWVGDCVGVIASMPFFWLLFERPARLLRLLPRWETIGYVTLLITMLGVAFGRWEVDNFKYFHLLFLPLVWAASVQGLAGVTIAAFVMQGGIIVAVQLLHLVTVMVFEMQLMGAVLASVGLLIGVIIDERQRISAELRQTLRLAAAGEMAGAVAHEINQPLTALSAYGMACEQLLERGENGDRLREIVKRMVAESYRAADVVRRLRDFFRTGATKLERLSLADLLLSASEPFKTKAAKQGVEFAVDPAPEAVLLADRLQLEVVLRNLISNAFEAVAEKPVGERRVRVAAQWLDEGRACIRVEDSGPGIAEGKAARVFEAFHSTKSSGLGLGLAISRAIAEAHGGALVAEETGYGLFKLILPTEENGEGVSSDDV